MQKFGISVDDDVARRVEAPLEYGDSRSERMTDLVAVGLEVEEELARHGWGVDSTQERRQIVRAAIQLWIKEQESV